MIKFRTLIISLAVALTVCRVGSCEEITDSLKLGDEYLFKQEYSKAKYEFSRLVKSNPGSSEAHRGLGDAIYYSKPDWGKVKKSHEEYTKAIQLDPANSKAHYGLAQCHLSFHEYDSAISEGKKALEINPKYVEAQFAIAAAYDLSDQIEKAITEYKKVLDLDPDNRKAIGNLATLYMQKQDYPTSILIRKGYLKSHPQDTQMLMGLAKAYRLDEKYDQTISYCEEVLSIDKKNRDAKDWIKMAENGKKARKIIIDLIDTILKEYTNSADPWEKRVSQRLINGESKEIIVELKPMTEKERKDGRACFFFAMASFLNGDHWNAALYGASANGFEYHQEHLKEFNKLTYQYDLSLTPFIR
jgi:tetratricopeptide (TPR) repeat protein